MLPDYSFIYRKFNQKNAKFNKYKRLIYFYCFNYNMIFWAIFSLLLFITTV